MITPLKQGSSNSVFFGKDEIVVSETLLDLPNLIDSECRRQFTSVCWRTKRKRSAIQSTTSSPSPSCSQPEKERRALKIIKKGETTAAAPATSPSTPLSFSPSESDEQKSSKQSMKLNSKKRTMEELLEILYGLDHNRNLLKGEVDTMRSKHFKLSATNLKLKAKKQEEMTFGQKTEKNSQLGLINGMHIEHYQCQMTNFAPQQHHQQFLVECKAIYESQNYGQRTPPSRTSPYHGMRLVNLGPRGIPDLNVCAEESCSQPLDLMSKMMMDNKTRLRAAAARKRRIVKLKETKNQGRSQSQRHPGP